MRDTQYPLRKAMISVLTGNVSYKSTLVKFYDEKKKGSDIDPIYGIFGTQQTANAGQIDTAWITDELITLEITHKTEFEVTKDYLNGVADQILQLLMPTRVNDALPDPTLMQIQNFELDNAISRAIEISATESILSIVLTFSCQMVQQA